MDHARESSPHATHATQAQRRFAASVVLASAAFFLATAPFARTPMAPAAAFIPIYETALVVCDLVTAALLLAQLRFVRSRGLLALACGYLFTALVAIGHALTFPGLFSASGLLGAGPQSTAWLYMFWHAGFPVFVTAFAFMDGASIRTRDIAVALAATAAAAIGLCAAATAGHDALPAIMAGPRYTPLMSFVVACSWGASVVALAAVWKQRRPHSVLDLWVMVVMLAWVFDIALSAVLNGGRFDLGFYAGRIYGLAASALVLVVLLFENGSLYARLRARTAEAEKARAAALAAEQAKGDFLAAMSHEIRTPMNGVMGMLELLALTPLDRDQRHALGVVRESGSSLLRIIDDILDFSKIEAGKLELRPAPAYVHDIVRDACDVHSGNASAKGLALVRHVDAALGRAVLVDALRVRQILSNLVSNAVKFTRTGGVYVDAALLSAQDAGFLRVRFSVRDTGVGVCAAEAARLFEPFTQASSSGSGGTGLGLSICMRLARLMGGTLAMESTPGAGTTMELTLPLPPAGSQPANDPTPAANGVLGPAAAAPSIEDARRDGTLVLVVDDHPVNRMLLVRQLQVLGHAAQSAEDGNAALDLWRQGGYALVLTDCHMPGMDGYELARRIRELERGASRVPIVACTANALGEAAALCEAAGMDDRLTKPVTLAQLERALRRWCPPGTPPIDRTALAEATLGNPDLERTVLEEFRRSREKDVAALEGAIAERDAALLVLQAHRLKGASRAVGAAELADASECIERAGQAGDWETILSAMAALHREARRLDEHMEAPREESRWT